MAKAKKAEIKVGSVVAIVNQIERNGASRCTWDEGGEMKKLMRDAVKGTVVELWEDPNYGKRVSIQFGDKVFTVLPECLSDNVLKGQKKKAINLQRIVNEAKKKISGWGTGGVSNFMIVLKNGEVREHKSTICHAAFRQYGKNDCYHTLLDTVTNVKKNCKEGSTQYSHAKRYINDILRESPWAHCFKTKTAETALKTCVEYHMDVSSHHIAGAFTALRESSEYSHLNESYVWLRKQGFDFGIAYLISRFYQRAAKGWIETSSWNSGHKALSCGMDVKDVLKFFKTGYHRAPVDECLASKGETNYKVFDSIARTEGYGGRVLESLEEFFKKIVKKKDVGEGWARMSIITDEVILKLANTLIKKQGEIDA